MFKHKNTNIFIKRQAFTLLEMILVIVGFFILIGVIVQMYERMSYMRNVADARQTLIKDSYYMLEKFNIILQDYNIDYEEYYNRSMVGCDSNQYWNNFLWNVWENGVCDNFTNFGNKNSILWIDNQKHKLYYCSSIISENIPDKVLQNVDVSIWSWCFIPAAFDISLWYLQSYGQYQEHFWNRKQNVDYRDWAVGDEDDSNLWLWPVAIQDTSNIEELYMISSDKTRRILLRRNLLDTKDQNGDGLIDKDIEKRYTIQQLQLKGLDAWNNHDFDINNSLWVYDGTIDTRACDYSQGYICQWNSLWWIYQKYNLPIDINDWWANLFEKNITIADRNIQIYPDTNPDLAWLDYQVQINPYFSIKIQNKLYWEIRKTRLRNTSMDEFQMTLQTTFNTKNNYTKF